jgi:actin cytoskeleton-regulatory complex protein PAN1
LYRAPLIYFVAFGEDAIINAHPSKSGSDWWYGSLASGGKPGFFPATYVQVIQPGNFIFPSMYWEFLISACPSVKAKAIYDYTSTDANEATFTQGDEFSIVDTSDPVWWKADQGSVITLVPASYLELIEGKWNYRFLESFLFTLRRH